MLKNEKHGSSDSGRLIYADTNSADGAAKPASNRKRRVAMFLLTASVAFLIAMAATTLWHAYQDRQTRYGQACALLEQKEYEDAAGVLEALGNFRDSQAILARLKEQEEAYRAADDLLTQQRYSESIAAFRALGDYADSAERAACQVTYQMALDLIAEIDVGKTQLLTRILTDQARLTDENSYPTTVGYEAAAALLESLGDYRSAPALVDRCYYSAGLVKLGWNDWEGALAYTEKMTPDTAAEFLEEYRQRYQENNEQEGP